MRRLIPMLIIALVGGVALPAFTQSNVNESDPMLQLIQGSSSRDFDRSRSRRDRDIRIVGARYGVEHRACNAIRPVRRMCQGRSSCTVRATNRLCGDPLPGVVKVLTISYQCDR